MSEITLLEVAIQLSDGHEHDIPRLSLWETQGSRLQTETRISQQRSHRGPYLQLRDIFFVPGESTAGEEKINHRSASVLPNSTDSSSSSASFKSDWMT